VHVQTAHLGHWYVQLAFAVPALIVIGYIARDSLRRRWRERRGGRPDADARKPPERPGPRNRR
jgi:hypothetical protein